MKQLILSKRWGHNDYTSVHMPNLIVAEKSGSNESGIPRACLLSKSISEVTKTKFFEATNTNRLVQTLSCREFRSDAAPAYAIAWTAVMGAPEKQ